MKHTLFIIMVFLIILPSCKKALDVSPESEFAPGNVLTTEKGIRAVLFSSYSAMQSQALSRNLINISEVTTDIATNSGGNENLFLSQFINFTWDPSIASLQTEVWGPYYRSIRDANVVLENLENAQMPEANRKLIKAEARVLRAYAYDILYNWFGPVPLRTSSTQEVNLGKATVAELNTFIENEITEAVADLPLPGREEAFGRYNKGVAHAVLAKHFLNTKQWQKAADACQTVMGYNYYQLFPSFKDMFRVENEGNKEMILVRPCRNENNYGNWFQAGAMPPAFKNTTQIPEFTFTNAMSNFATQYRLRTAFVNTMAANDSRNILIIKSYVNLSGVTVNLMATADNARSLKYWDNGTIGNNSGNDVPVLRYADILLSRAEALNELTGPTQQALDLINLIRVRSSVPALLLADFASKESLRDHILKERGWEFISEAHRREDLIRHGKFISFAIARGISAKEHHVVFPIPQVEIDANKAIKQNDGY